MFVSSCAGLRRCFVEYKGISQDARPSALSCGYEPGIGDLASHNLWVEVFINSFFNPWRPETDKNQLVRGEDLLATCLSHQPISGKHFNLISSQTRLILSVFLTSVKETCRRSILSGELDPLVDPVYMDTGFSVAILFATLHSLFSGRINSGLFNHFNVLLGDPRPCGQQQRSVYLSFAKSIPYRNERTSRYLCAPT